MTRGVWGMVAGLLTTGLLATSGAQAGSAALRVEVRTQVQEVCEVAHLGPGRLTLRCTAGAAAPQEPRLLPGMPAAVRALGPLRLEAVRREAGGAELIDYVVQPALPVRAEAESGVRVFWFD
ncbi:hypothetical protein L1280_001965 [Deinococcus sp. HSC-46F16]|uniref:hypothetical protein n=1 Tax=Deinococcus sp. HSC-46F16 TaxID=2910968 RepID=UPI0020A1B5E9|nr:hypothetical protein [Deinococcus sp. HSC-46F16]MCP2014813.1 hypothetical protein [Deinococcus sp. HSC-46F16]